MVGFAGWLVFVFLTWFAVISTSMYVAWTWKWWIMPLRWFYSSFTLIQRKNILIVYTLHCYAIITLNCFLLMSFYVPTFACTPHFLFCALTEGRLDKQSKRQLIFIKSFRHYNVLNFSYEILGSSSLSLVDRDTQCLSASCMYSCTHMACGFRIQIQNQTIAYRRNLKLQ